LENRAKTAFGTLSKSFCEYTKLKTIVGQSDVTLESLVSKLNSIYSYKIDFVTTLALNEILTKSDLKNTFKTQFEQLIHNFFGTACLNVDVFDRAGKRFIPREWFIAPLKTKSILPTRPIKTPQT